MAGGPIMKRARCLATFFLFWFQLVLLWLPVQSRRMNLRVGSCLSALLAGFSALGQMTSNEVATVMAQALSRGNYFVTNGMTTNVIVAVVDREGFVLGVRSSSPSPDALDIIDAIAKAGTAAFLSSDEQALTSRTAGFIVQQHFPPESKTVRRVRSWE